MSFPNSLDNIAAFVTGNPITAGGENVLVTAINAIEGNIGILAQNGFSTIGAAIAQPSTDDFRLSLTSGTAVTNTDTTNTTLYLTPYAGTRIALFNTTTSAWTLYNTAQISLSLSGVVASTNYDVFVYSNSGTPTLVLGPAWTNDTTRATALQRQDGVWCLSTNLAYRWVGIIRGSATGTVADTAAQRFLLNAANRVPRALRYTQSTAPGGTSTTFAQVDSVEVEYLTEGEQTVFLTGKATSDNTNGTLILGIGSSATAAVANCIFGSARSDGTGTACASDAVTFLQESPAAGHYPRYLIYKVITNSTTFREDNGPQIALFGSILC